MRTSELKILNLKTIRLANNGIASLGISLLLGSIIIEIGLGIALLAYLVNFSNLGIKLSAEALSAAKSGINDGILQVERGVTNANYVLTAGNSTANVTICKGCLSDFSKIQITSVGSSLGKQHKLESYVEVDPVTDLVKVEFIREVSL